MSLPAFAELLERLVFSPGRNTKLALLAQWFTDQPDPERGLGLAAMTESLKLATAKPAMLREITMARVDPTLFQLSYDYVGDLAETIALIWPKRAGVNAPPPALSDIITALESTPKAEVPALIAGWLDTLDGSGRLALVKLLTGGLRVGVSARLARLALAEWSGQAVEEIEEAWHAVLPPYGGLFAWLEGKAPRPDPQSAPIFPPPHARPPPGSGRYRGPGPGPIPRRMEMGRDPGANHRRAGRAQALEPGGRGYFGQLSRNHGGA